MDSLKLSRIFPQLFAVLAANLGAFGLGTVNGWTSPGLPDLVASNDIGELTKDQQSWIGSLVSLACFISVYPSGYVIQRFGRKPVMIFLGLPFVAGWLLMTFATNVWMMYAGRFMTGLCSGGFSVAAPVYIGEIAEDKIRGALGSTFQLLIVTGILFTYVVGAFVSWKWLALICGFPSLLCMALLIFIPESPRYLLHRLKTEEARSALMWFRGTKDFSEVEHEFNLMSKSVEESKGDVTSFHDLFQPSILKPTSIGISLLVFQQFSGIDAITFYTVDIFIDAGSSIDPNLATIIIGLVQVVFNIAALYLCERLGRRILLINSGIVLALSLITLGVFFHLKEIEAEITDSIGWLPLISLVIYSAAFSLGIGPLGWQMIPELLPNHVIGAASAVATSSLWVLSFLITRFFTDLAKALSTSGVFWMFGGVTLFSVFYIYFIVPETKGRSLDDIQDQINKKGLYSRTENFPR